MVDGRVCIRAICEALVRKAIEESLERVFFGTLKKKSEGEREREREREGGRIRKWSKKIALLFFFL